MHHAKPLAALAAALALSSAAGAAEPPIRTLLITGHNNHNWRYTSRMHQDTLEATGRFVVTITDDPAKALADAAELNKYQLFVLDYNDSQSPKRWGQPAEKNFESAVATGRGVCAIHSADNAFKADPATNTTAWSEYEKMLALMWRDGTGHGDFHTFDVAIVDPNHPITRGMADLKAHPDELYHKLVNVHNTQFHLLAQAMSSTDHGGTGNMEPMAFILSYGKGSVFCTPLGHTWDGAENTKPSVCDPQFKALVCRGAEWAATGKVTLPAVYQDTSTHNFLTDQEKADKWKLLFDGKTPAGWRAFKQEKFPDKGWSVKEGVLIAAQDGGGGDIVTTDQFGDFEFKCDWRVAKGGNSGIMYRCTEDHNYPWETGPECQILDDANHADGKKPTTRAGTMYDVFPCAFDVSRPAGEWNHIRIVAKGPHIEHWLNGFKVVDADLTSEAYQKAHDASKWTGMPDYAKRAKGFISLQDHGDLVEFRDIKVKKLD